MEQKKALIIRHVPYEGVAGCLALRAPEGAASLMLTRWHSCLARSRTPADALSRAQGVRLPRSVARVPSLRYGCAVGKSTGLANKEPFPADFAVGNRAGNWRNPISIFFYIIES